MADKQERHVFISYVRENQDQVDRLCQDLEQHGVNVWLDRNSIKPGARWKDAIQQAIRHGDFFIACFSDEYTSKVKTHMNEELVLATEELRKYPPDREWFIPVLLSECDVPARSIGGGETLLDINRVPLYEDWDASIKRILSVIKPIPKDVQNLINLLRSENVKTHQQAAEALGKIGPDAKAAVPELSKALNDPDRRIHQEVANALVKIGAEAVPALIKALKDKDEVVRFRAASALSVVGSKAKAAVPELSKALKDPNENVRKRVAAAIGNIGPDAKAAVPSLIKAFIDNNKDVRFIATQALGYIGAEAVPALIKALKDKDEVVRFRAALALGNIGPEVKAVVPELSKALNDSEKLVRSSAVLALDKINTPEALKALEEYYKKSD